MPKVRIKVNRAAVRDLLRGREIQADLRRRAERIAETAGPGHDVDIHVGRNRARADIATETFDAMVAEATHRTLSRAIDAGR